MIFIEVLFFCSFCFWKGAMFAADVYGRFGTGLVGGFA
jgi:hypothetical protein